VAAWLEAKRPDVLFFCFNDHATTFFFDHYPTFALGVSDQYRIADEGQGVRRIPPLRGHAPMSRHIARSLVADEFDLTIFQDLPLDHGLHSPLTMMWPSTPDWPGRVVPLVVNVLQHPLPKPARCYKLGKALGKAIRSYPEDLKVAVVGTGGLSHQLIGERAGFNDEAWDREFLELIDRDPERLARMSIEDFAQRGGNEGAEVIMWLIMRAALDEGARKVHENYYLPMTTAMAVALFE
jgi:protocatechuate 4,5-dioxygenase beta chain